MFLFRLRFTLSLSIFLLLLALPATTVLARSSRAKTHKSLPGDRKAHHKTVLRGRASWYGAYFQGRRTTSGERFDRFEYTCAHKTLPFGTRLRVTNPNNGHSVVVRVTDRGPFRRHRIIDLSEIAARPLNIVELGAATVIAEVVPATTPLGPTNAPANLAALQAADPAPEAAFTTYSMPLPKPPPPIFFSDSVAAAARAELAAVPLVTPLTATTQVYLVQAGVFDDYSHALVMQARIESLYNVETLIERDSANGAVSNRVLVGRYENRADAERLRRRLLVWGIGGAVRPMPAGS